MTQNDVALAAKAMIEKDPSVQTIRVAIDSPVDCTNSIKAFRKLGCKVKVEKDGALLIITKPSAS